MLSNNYFDSISSEQHVYSQNINSVFSTMLNLIEETQKKLSSNPYKFINLDDNNSINYREFIQLFEKRKEIYTTISKPKSLTVDFEYIEDSKATFNTTEITQIIDNLLFNIIFISPDSSTIKINVKQKTKTEITLIFISKGIGFIKSEYSLFDSEILNSIVLSDEVKRKNFGLAVVNELVKKNQGLMSVYSNKLSGTTVTITLPI